MAYNSLKAYWIWRRKKEAEEKEFRTLGANEDFIAEIHDFDRIAYNSDYRFYKRLCDVWDFYEEVIADESQQGYFRRAAFGRGRKSCNVQNSEKDKRKNFANTFDESAWLLRKGYFGNFTYFQNFCL